ncbi:hypothetical protein [Burkholderia pseudomultivorans]|uniref:hypothetical protein n=1 Tax=Burkholderia pseudomultivorans TaxID=1207504 RepID=UPI000AFE3E95|nr:hypothetical protein [Burkholderia pseudomultivorans]
MISKAGITRTKYWQRARWLALLPVSALLAGCPPLIVPNVQTETYHRIYSIPANPVPWLALEKDGIDLYMYQDCFQGKCEEQNLVALKSGAAPDWKNLLDAPKLSWQVQGENVPMRRPLSAYVPGTKYRLMGAFGRYPEIVLANPGYLANNKNTSSSPPEVLYRKVEDFNTLAYPGNIDIQLVIYDDDHQWIFANQPEFHPDLKDPPTDLFVPGKLFRFEASDDARLNRPMALYYSSPKLAPSGYRVVAGKAAEWRIDKYRTKHDARQIALADVVFPAVPLKLDTLAVDSKTVSTRPTLRCRYSHTQFNLGWLDAAQHGAPTEKDRKGCAPYQE